MISTMLLIADVLIYSPGQPVPTQVVDHNGMTVVHQPGQIVPTTIVEVHDPAREERIARLEAKRKFDNDILAAALREEAQRRMSTFHPKGDSKCRLCQGTGIMVRKKNATLDNPKNWCKCVKKAKKAWDAEQKTIQDAQK